MWSFSKCSNGWNTSGPLLVESVFLNCSFVSHCWTLFNGVQIECDGACVPAVLWWHYSLVPRPHERWPGNEAPEHLLLIVKG